MHDSSQEKLWNCCDRNGCSALSFAWTRLLWGWLEHLPVVKPVDHHGVHMMGSGAVLRQNFQ
jgi:hypothetical protein